MAPGGLGALRGDTGAPPPDPHHHELYLNSSDFLALLNNEREHPNASGEGRPPAPAEPLWIPPGAL